ncbi:hypothetical protein [Sulfurovum sp. TSL1]|uniref:hypothetical protein n=1 Tax=Sulfurovum sp. TSL1 TaxID=2826994 RepID=UPI001CC6E565|nr:hypothetical protein [Sulfurovum sp. TSL1]GIT97621.1 hypothetical protein TSL1_04420 [Sulfurovum sp. TSL1]
MKEKGQLINLADGNVISIIEVFLGEKDKIMSAQQAFNYFGSVTTTYFMKRVGRALKS